MANDIPSPFDVNQAVPDAADSSIEVLLAGNIADDDMMWVVRCPVTELFALIARPVEWVAALGDLPGWRSAGSGTIPAPVLTRDFAISVQTTDRMDPQGRVVIQGISETNALSVVVGAGSMAPAVRAFGMADAQAIESNPFQAFWEAIAQDPSKPPTLKKHLPINVAAPIAHFFAHFEILDPAETPAERAARTGTFLLATALDPQGYAEMLNGLDQTVTVVDAAGAQPGGAFHFDAASTLSLTYANIEGSGAEEDDEDSAVCGSIAGPVTGDPIEGGTGIVTATTTKRYGGEKGHEGEDGSPTP